MLKIIHEGGGNSLINNGLDTYTHHIDDYSFLDVTEIANTPQDNEYLSSLGLSADTNLREYLPKGTKYTILAYKEVRKYSNDYILHVQQEFTVGDINPKIELDANQNYTLFIVSTGNSTSAKIEDENDINNVKFIPNNSTNAIFLYQRIRDFTPRGDKNNVLDIKLENCGVALSVIIDVSELLPGSSTSITSISDLRLEYSIPKEVRLLYNSKSYEFKNVLPIKNTSFLNNRKQYKVDFHDSFFSSSWVKFYANIKIKGINDNVKNISNFEFMIRLNSRNTIVLKPKVCGGYTGKNNTNFREFTCYNLGARNINMNWNEIRSVNTQKQGNIYAWGTKTPVKDLTRNPYHRGRTWPESGNPCPSGFRVPTLHEWKSLNGNNIGKLLYYREDGNVRNIAIRQIGRMLFLNKDSDWKNYIWTATERRNNIDLAEHISASIRNDIGSSAEGSSTNDLIFYGKHNALPVRCIRKLPNEK